jgi:hypothetical protein
MAKTANRPPATHERPSSFVSLLSGWVQQGIESFFATQRILVDMALRQNTSAMKSIRKELSRDEARAEAAKRPRSVLFEMAVEGTSNYIEAQRILLDLAQEENELVMKGVKERVGDSETAAAMTNLLRRSIDTFLDMQQNFLTIASRRTQGWLKGEKNHVAKDHATKERMSLAREAMNEFVASQKKFLKVVDEETHNIGEKKEHNGRKMARTDLAELGREATDSFIQAQKRLLDLAGQQVNVNTTALSRAADVRMPIRIMPLMDIANEGVKSMVDAEKALVDSIAKTRTRSGVKAGEEPVKRPVRHTRTRARKARASATTAA